MNKTAIKNFAVWARRKLISDITYKAGLIGITESGIAEALPQSTSDLQFFDIGTKDYAKVVGKEIVQRDALARAIREKEKNSDYETAFKAIIEEVAYTWFNRLIAIRFMEVNDYLPSRIRVLSSENPAKNEPDFVTTPFDTDMEFTMAEQDKIMQLKEENKLDELFRMLFIKQCNKLHEILPELFEKTDDYTELLLSISFTDSEGIVTRLVNDIDEGDFNIEKEGQVEIIGWLYQYYNIEPKDETFALLKKNVKITKERIPAATQLFTPDWIVRYMVENSLGRLWVEGHPSDSLKENWKYYLEEAEQEESVQAQLDQIREEYCNLNPEEIKVIDPCMGSGHILVYCFDVLMQIYESQGYTQRDAAQSILEYNIFGLDIDKRAAQLAYFAVMMKARQYDRRIFSRQIRPNLYVVEESNYINKNQIKFFGAELSTIEKNNAASQIVGLLDDMVDAKEYGSILTVNNYDWDLLTRFVKKIDDTEQMTLETIGIDQTQNQLLYLIKIGQIMAQRYNVAITNPPYMNNGNMSSKMLDYVKQYYLIAKSDLCTVFMLKCLALLKKDGLLAMITQQAWMFLSSYAELREHILNYDIVNMAHLGARAFEEIGGEVVQTTTWVQRKSAIKKYKSSFVKLTEFNSQDSKENAFHSNTNVYFAAIKDFEQIPNQPVVYWLSERAIQVFGKQTISNVANPKRTLQTGDSKRFMRIWHEVSADKVDFTYSTREDILKSKKKWFMFSYGGTKRKWYGNLELVVNWENNGAEIKGTGKAIIPSEDKYFLENLGWSKVTSGDLSMRYYPPGVIPGDATACLFNCRVDMHLLEAYMNSKVAMCFLNVLSPTLNYATGTIAQVPYFEKEIESNKEQIIPLVMDCNKLAKQEWDSFETSWDFEEHPIVKISKGLWDATAVGASMQYYYNEHPKVSCPLELCYLMWQGECNERFNRLKENEEELNRIFISVYGLENELSPEVEEKNITLRKADLGREIRSLISYAVGCMFGRYSLDTPGLVYAGGAWDQECYSSFIPDKDNCIPITDEEYFEDDIVGQFCGWLKKVFGADTLEANLEFIAKCLGNKGTTSREVLRNYFLNDFVKEHIKMFQKCPIYWLFDSGKQDGFKALVYMHRWNADTVGNLRVEYLHKMQHTYEREIVRMQDTIDNSSDSREVSKATKRKDKLQKQLKESKDYDAKLAHIALSRIDIDLDDGVKVNYEKVQTDREGKRMQILSKI